MALHPETLAVHADNELDVSNDVSPPLHPSSTFRFPSDPEQLVPLRHRSAEDKSHVYSRLSNPNTARFEALLTSLIKAPCLTYTSGLSALLGILVCLKPRQIAIAKGYPGCHGTIALVSGLNGMKKIPLDCPAEDLGAGDVVFLETPVNPTGLASNIQDYADKAHSRGAILVVDATFGPPGLQDPFKHGADIVLHSGTKYLGGHSDILCGVVATNNQDWFAQLKKERFFLGGVMGSLEGWLGVRSMRTLHLRVLRQSESATKLVQWLNSALQLNEACGASTEPESRIIKAALSSVTHASLQTADLEQGWLKAQMPNGFGPVFSICMTSRDMANRFPSQLKLFAHCTSLGGVESMVEWRTMTDLDADPTLLRVSIGVENWEDLKSDILQAFEAVLDDEKVVQ
ncbi:cystathionine beta-lyase/cystathionine gamma-synthase [Trichoderma citrinoviride]|uniref:Cystathionine beta-lyase/cystathionine gamma-synthase n=1 Tax=Trichoderma citrinoviride TaxID=58853 RepID=A0A2T4B699_9HYPO|nr:cystathionine beta-lyase/cystathionine gamma-synthase [Trichoderma citrinoviride]PTB64866.1 cystathionine beta-lyase/cystathionine gamma-synthase [Trichoderma citrinoviride]